MLTGKNTKIVGYGIILLSLALLFVLYTFTKNILALNEELHKDCPLPEGVCPYTRSIPAESVIGFTVSILMFSSGIYLALTEKEIEKSRIKQREKITKAVKTLKGDEKKAYEMLVDSDGFMFQNELVEKSDFSKVKVTRILDKLEGKGLVERRRRGMSNVVVLKH